MSREHLYKGKTIAEGKWIEGSLIIDEKGNYYIGTYIPSNNDVIVQSGRSIGKTLNRFLGIGFAMVDKDTVCEYTQLKDKHGKRIWENDIVKTDKFNTPNKHYVIKYDLLLGAFIGEDDGTMYFTTFDGDSDLFEIIGNRFDNSELLLER